MTHRLEAGTELRHRLANALGDGADLAVMFGHQHDDAIGFGKPVRAQHDRRSRDRRGSPSVEPSEAAVPSGELGDGTLEVGAAEAHPRHVDVDQLAVGQLPHQASSGRSVSGPTMMARSGSHGAGALTISARFASVICRPSRCKTLIASTSRRRPSVCGSTTPVHLPTRVIEAGIPPCGGATRSRGRMVSHFAPAWSATLPNSMIRSRQPASPSAFHSLERGHRRPRCGAARQTVRRRGSCGSSSHASTEE